LSDAVSWTSDLPFLQGVKRALEGALILIESGDVFHLELAFPSTRVRTTRSHTGSITGTGNQTKQGQPP
jgi:uncharacterized protein YfaT (DUF1175 family)